jgi:anti-anti-sigma regulatory factor
MAVGSIRISPTGSDTDTGATVTVHLHGDLTTGTLSDLCRALIDTIMRRKPARIIIDVREVTAMDACLIGTLRAAHDLAQDVQLPMTVDSAGSPVAEQLTREHLSEAA